MNQEGITMSANQFETLRKQFDAGKVNPRTDRSPIVLRYSEAHQRYFLGAGLPRPVPTRD